MTLGDGLIAAGFIVFGIILIAIGVATLLAVRGKADDLWWAEQRWKDRDDDKQ
jgi:hypothetical protein